jgi:outer membrane protein OmpA-like peptidoglycan-associated protein
VSLATLLTACSSDVPPSGIQSSDVVTGVVLGGATGAAVGAVATSGASVPITAAMGGIVGGAIATAIDENLTVNQRLVRKLEQDNIQVIRMGEDYMLVLPSKSYFYPNSTHISEAMYPAFKDMAAYINQFDIETIKVAGYTDNFGDPVRNLALSRQQAQNIADELSHAGIKPTMMYSIGYGEAYPIAYNKPEGAIENCRVQITFRRLTPQS